jgi:hypothetical protein
VGDKPRMMQITNQAWDVTFRAEKLSINQPHFFRQTTPLAQGTLNCKQPQDASLDK